LQGRRTSSVEIDTLGRKKWALDAVTGAVLVGLGIRVAAD